MGRGFAWLDTGTCESLSEASEFVKLLEKRQGLKIACLEEIALEKGFITANEAKKLGEDLLMTDYGKYIIKRAQQSISIIAGVVVEMLALKKYGKV